jgi:hypothetical protein
MDMGEKAQTLRDTIADLLNCPTYKSKIELISKFVCEEAAALFGGDLGNITVNEILNEYGLPPC